MARTPVWTSIADTLRAEIAARQYGPGDKLPTEAELSTRFGVNRHTVRRALADLVDKGILRTRRGAGVFVEAPPADYPIGRRVRFHQNIRASGREPAKKVLRTETRAADLAEARALEIAPGAPVVVYEGLSSSGEAPVALFTSIFPADRVPRVAEALAAGGSVTEALAANGVPDYVRRDTRISAEAASPTQALHLRVRENAPLLKTIAVNTLLDGTPIEYGITFFAGERIALTVAHDAPKESLD
ncbi:phosphonate metabolism transcriptional regulator PhnF [Seohaeicola zhoushanensis]|uniref:Phosphonate metabolism transcriptional regulator PhnF n=1 Tax=Seohaeicola zhoushanensis TaxID=1569283 RepID=A0A8J3GVE6_9RHOB|nr:phosphonate metabolism transcriptional regulator PhnF [Seohaeicola zhoushanensis]GHF42936.1 phosphonate metabolism transcriptional regulator PhnF [Seohaeicola zhoushanensis]